MPREGREMPKLKRGRPLADHEERRGFPPFKIYPTAEQVAALENLQKQTRFLWNAMLVGPRDDTRLANEAYAIREGLVGPKPERPDYDGMPPELAKLAREEHEEAMAAWGKAVHDATWGLECCMPRLFGRDLVPHYFGPPMALRHDYQLLDRMLGWAAHPEWDDRNRPGSAMLQSLVMNFEQKAQRRKKRRKDFRDMPLQVRSGNCFRLGDFGERGGKAGWYNCQVSINGLKIRGRLPGRLPGELMQGVAITRLADGWYASVKEVVAKRVLPEPTRGTIGLDMGLVDLVAFSEPVNGRERIPNKRDIELADQIAGMQKRAEECADKAQKSRIMNSVARLQQRAARHMLHVVHNEIVKPLADYAVIAIERLPANIGQRGTRRVSAIRTVIRLLKDRYGDRVREVDPCFTSQDCSRCGHRSKESWSYEHGRMGQCPACGLRLHRDVNAARNVARKAAELLAA